MYYFHKKFKILKKPKKTPKKTFLVGFFRWVFLGFFGWFFLGGFFNANPGWGLLSFDEFGLKVLHSVTGRMEETATGPLTSAVCYISAKQPDIPTVQFYSVRQKFLDSGGVCLQENSLLTDEGYHKLGIFGLGSAIPHASGLT